MAIFHEVRCQNFWKRPLTNQITNWGAKQGHSFTGVWKQIKQNCQWKRSCYPSQTQQPIPRCARPLNSHLLTQRLTQRLTWPHAVLFFLPRSFGARPLFWPGSPWSVKLWLCCCWGVRRCSKACSHSVAWPKLCQGSILIRDSWCWSLL